MNSLKKKVRDLQASLEKETNKRLDMEAKVGDIPGKLLNYEEKLCQLIKDCQQNMNMVTSSLSAATASMGRESQRKL